MVYYSFAVATIYAFEYPDRSKRGASRLEKDIPCIDINFAMSQLSGNREVLLSLLSRYQEEYRSVAERLSQLLTSEDTENALKLIHTMKGVSSNLGLRAIVESAKQFEDGVKAGGDPTVFIALLSSTVANTMQAIDDLANETPAADETQQQGSLRELLTQNKFVQPNELQTYLNALQAPEEQKSQLEEHILNLDYPSALAMLNELEQ